MNLIPKASITELSTRLKPVKRTHRFVGSWTWLSSCKLRLQNDQHQINNLGFNIQNSIFPTNSTQSLMTLVLNELPSVKGDSETIHFNWLHRFRKFICQRISTRLVHQGYTHMLTEPSRHYFLRKSCCINKWTCGENTPLWQQLQCVHILPAPDSLDIDSYVGELTCTNLK